MIKKAKKIANKIIDYLDNIYVNIKSDINKKLVIGISTIVFVSTLLIGLIFVSQFRILTVNKAEEDLKERSNQFVEIGKSLLNPTHQRPVNVYFEVIKNISQNEVWIIDKNKNILLSTTDIKGIEKTYKITKKETVFNKQKTTYEYSNYFKTKTLTIITPIIINETTEAFVLLHKDVESVYRSYNFFNYLIFISILISMLLSLILGIMYSKHFAKPIEKITDVTKEIKKRNYKIKTNIERIDQIGILANTIDDMTFEIEKNINEIEDLEKTAKELIANVSHEFKTPLTLIRGFTMNLKDKTIKPTNEVYDKIINNTITLETLVNDLLDLSKYENKKHKLKKEKFHIEELIKEVVENMKEISNKKQIKIQFKKQIKSQQIEADYIKFKQLLTIFLDNSIKFSKEKTKITINLETDKIEIIDQGKGIEENNLQKIFDKYYKSKEEEKGYGIGLYIAKHIIDLHNYKLDIKSELNKGTKVTILF